MKSFSITQTITGALAVVALIGVSAAAFNYQGDLNFNFGTDGVKLKINGRAQPEEEV